MTGGNAKRVSHRKKVAVIGAGWVSERVHLPYLAGSEKLSVAGVFGVDRERGQRVAAEWNVPAFACLDEVLSSDAEVVIVCTPPSSHARLADQALRSGKHLICEKPLALARSDAASLAETAAAMRLGLFCCMTSRFRRDVALMRTAIEEGRIGEPRLFGCFWLRRSGTPSTEGGLENGVLWDLGTHLVDLVLWLSGWSAKATATGFTTWLGSIEHDTAAAWHERTSLSRSMINADDTGAIDVVFGSEGSAHIEVSWATWVPHDVTELMVHGTEGTLLLRTVFGWSPDRSRPGGHGLYLSAHARRGWIALAAHDDEPREYRSQLDHFFSSLDAGATGSAELPVLERGVGILAQASHLLRVGALRR